MKKKIAIFVNGWNFENLYRFEQTLFDCAPENSMDFFSFSWNATHPANKYDRSRSTIFDLPDLKKFDALVIYNPGSNLAYKSDYIHNLAIEANIPTISVGRNESDFYYIGIDNYAGTKELSNYLIEEHNVRDIIFIAGLPYNEDSNIRIKAVKDSFKEHDLTLDDDHIFYSEWRTDFSAAYVAKLIDDGKKLPDAFVCANDYLAESVCSVLMNNGYKIPEDCIVTGFDNLEESRVFYPSIASVDQQFDTLGKNVYEILANIFDNKEYPRETILNCKFIPRESCGCQNVENDNAARIEFCTNTIANRKYENEIDIALEKLERSLTEADDYEDMLCKFKRSFYESDGCEGKSMYLMLDTYFPKLTEKSFDSIPKYKYADKMTVVVGKTDSVPTTRTTIDTSELIPDYTGEGPNHSYFILPIFYETYVCGYIAFVDRIFWLRSKTFIRFENHITQALVVYRRNIQLTYLNNMLSELMEKDPLTAVKNRTAFERYIDTMEKNYSISRKNYDDFAVVFFDINDLKKINDNLGHEEGDEYINNCCHLICSIYKHSPVFRVGGDEFVTILQGEDYNDREILLYELRHAMEATQNNDSTFISPTENISIASGMAIFDESIDNNIRSVFKRADNEMYENKRKMKNK